MKPTVEITTDGSCHESKKAGGWAAVIVCWPVNADPHCIILRDNARTKSSYFCEIAPVVDALKAMPDGTKANIEIRSDHRGLVDLIEHAHVDKRRTGKIPKKDFKDKKNSEIMEELRDELKRLDVRATWVKGHGKDELNKWCDKMAGEESYALAWGLK
jgi:ribonuclease HI